MTITVDSEDYPLPEGRHPSTIHMMKMLRPNPNLPGHLYMIADDFWTMAYNFLEENELPDSLELTAGLRKMLEAKDCIIRAALDTEPVSYTDR